MNASTTSTKSTKSTTQAVATKPDTKVSAQLIVTKSLAASILAPYRESDSAKANKVLSLLKFTGKGHTADSIIRDTLAAADAHGIVIPSGFRSSEVGLALGVARAMASIEIATTKTASAGIAAALVDISRAHGTVGGGKAGMIAALDAAQDGTDNGAEVAERLTAIAVTVTASENARRRANTRPVIERGARPEGNTTKSQADDDTTPEDSAPAKGTPEVAASSLASASITRLIAELDARITAGTVPTLADQARFDQLAANWELALSAVDA